MTTHLRTRTFDAFITFAFYALFVPLLCGLVFGAFIEQALRTNEPFSPGFILLFAMTEPYRYAGAVAIISGLIAGVIVARQGRLSILNGTMVPLAGYLIAGVAAAAMGMKEQSEILGSGFEFTEPILRLLGIMPRRFGLDDVLLFVVFLVGGAIVLSQLYRGIVVGILKRTV